MSDLVATLRSGKVLVMDGAMGTQLQRLTRNLSIEPGERYNLTDPELVGRIHCDYIDAGAEVLLTNTFQANPAALAQQKLAGRQAEIWQAALRLARAQRPRFVLADIGPIEHGAKDIARAILRDCRGADGVLLETWSSLDALKQFAAPHDNGLPLLVSFTFHRVSGELMTFEGLRPEDCACAAHDARAVAVGANCGKDVTMGDMLELVQRYRAACPLPIFARPNAGTPTQLDSAWSFPLSPSAMAGALPALLHAGVAMVGGCCGTTPAHIRAIREVIDSWHGELRPARNLPG